MKSLRTKLLSFFLILSLTPVLLAQVVSGDSTDIKNEPYFYLSKSGLKMQPGDLVKLEVITNIEFTRGIVPSWSSTNPECVNVSSSGGDVKALRPGTGEIIVKYGTYRAACKVTVYDASKEKYFKISPQNPTLKVDSEIWFNIKTNIDFMMMSSIPIFQSSNPEVLAFTNEWKPPFSDSVLYNADYQINGRKALALKEGSSLVICNYGGFTDTTLVTVTNGTRDSLKMITIYPQKAQIMVNQRLQLKCRNLSMSPLPLTWKSTNTSVATVDSNGIVLALSKGVSTIVVSLAGIADSARIEVIDTVQTPHFYLKPDYLELSLQEKEKLNVVFNPDMPNIKMALRFYSENPTIVMVDGSGVVTGLSEGITLVYAVLGEQKAVAKVMVKGKSQDSLRIEKRKMNVGDSFFLREIAPKSTVSFTIQSNQTFTLDFGNKVTALKPGQGLIRFLNERGETLLAYEIVVVNNAWDSTLVRVEKVVMPNRHSMIIYLNKPIRLAENRGLRELISISIKNTDSLVYKSVWAPEVKDASLLADGKFIEVTFSRDLNDNEVVTVSFDSANVFEMDTNESVTIRVEAQVGKALSIAQNTELFSEIYPNPMASDVTVKSKAGIVKIVIYSTSGKVVYTQSINKQVEVRLSPSLSNGVYFLVVTNNNGGVDKHKLLINN